MEQSGFEVTPQQRANQGLDALVAEIVALGLDPSECADETSLIRSAIKTEDHGLKTDANRALDALINRVATERQGDLAGLDSGISAVRDAIRAIPKEEKE
jgi:hypothetical protein